MNSLRKRVVVLAALGALGATGWLAFAQSPVRATSIRSTTGSAGDGRTGASASETRVEVANDDRSGQEQPVPALANDADLDNYLADLEREARHRGTVGDARARAARATKQLEGKVHRWTLAVKLRDFGYRMAVMEREERLGPTRTRLDELASRMREEKDRAARGKLAREYATLAAQLPPPSRLAAMDRLESMKM